MSSEVYTFGILFVVINFSYGFATTASAIFYLPVFYKLKATSAYEVSMMNNIRSFAFRTTKNYIFKLQFQYLEKRFGYTTRLLASLTYSLQMILYMGVVLYAPALALEAVTKWSITTSIWTIGLVCTFYSTIGGMKAVLVTDVFQ